ncbi:MAG: lipopolysaccharide transport periplasmic protein LptA [Steroidobacteraceae bacterium]|jgi:lipopolysaccharide transport protein LptA
MADSILKALAVCVLLAPAVPASAAAARETQQPILLDAQSTEVDLRTNSAIFHKVRISQGSMSVTADQGQATKHTTGLDFDNSVWVFRGNVKITMNQGQLTSDDAQITFADKEITKAVADGRPAEFEEPVAKTGKTAHGHANTIDYDVAKSQVHFSKDAYLSNGDHEISGESLKYNILAQTVVAEEAEQGSQRVHIIITPPPPKSPPPKP